MAARWATTKPSFTNIMCLKYYSAVLLCLLCAVLPASVTQAFQLLWASRSDSDLHNSDITAPRAMNASSSATTVCEMYGLQPKQHNASQQLPKVIDCFLASNEVDLTEIRLRELGAGGWTTVVHTRIAQCNHACSM